MKKNQRLKHEKHLQSLHFKIHLNTYNEESSYRKSEIIAGDGFSTINIFILIHDFQMKKSKNFDFYIGKMLGTILITNF